MMRFLLFAFCFLLLGNSMMDLDELQELIKGIYRDINELDDKYTHNDFKDYPHFAELTKDILNDTIQWRYLFLLEDQELLFSLSESLNDLVEFNDKSSFLEVERFSTQIISDLKALKNIKNLQINKEIMEKEIILKHDLKFINNLISTEGKLSKLKTNIDHLHEQIDQAKSSNDQVLLAYEEAKKIINDLKSKNFAYNQIIDQDSNKRIRQHYDEIYNTEIKIANDYRNWALIIFVAVGGLIAIVILVTLSQNVFAFFYPKEYSKIILGWDSLIKTFMLFSLTTPAWYLTKESSKHRKVAYKAQMLGTELASFPLYVREFKDEDRLELRKHLADRFFGQELYSDSKTQASNDNSLEQIKLMTEANKVLAEALKAKKIIEN